MWILDSLDPSPIFADNSISNRFMSSPVVNDTLIICPTPITPDARRSPCISQHPLRFCFLFNICFCVPVAQEDEFAGLSIPSEANQNVVNRVNLFPDTLVAPHTTASTLGRNLKNHVPEVLVRYCGS